MPLPLKFVKEIHARLSVRYGSSWASKWSGLDQAAIEADWAEQLDGMQPESIKKALASLPHDFPPTAPAFRALGAIRDESRPMAALPAPDPAGVRRIASELQKFHITRETPAEFMARLRDDVEAGRASQARIDHYRIAVANGYYDGATAAQFGDFTPIPNSSLPPGMRQPEPQHDAEGFAA